MIMLCKKIDTTVKCFVTTLLHSHGMSFIYLKVGPLTSTRYSQFYFTQVYNEHLVLQCRLGWMLASAYLVFWWNPGDLSRLQWKLTFETYFAWHISKVSATMDTLYLICNETYESDWFYTAYDCSGDLCKKSK